MKMSVELHIERWIQLRDELYTSDVWMSHFKQRDNRRLVVREEILSLWSQYRNNEITTESFRMTFDRKTRTDWDVFGLKGLSGAMFLNKLVKHIYDEHELARQIRLAMRVPLDTDAGYSQMRDFQAYLDEVIEMGVTSKRQLQPARLSFLLSAFWHLQDTETWPVYYLSAREVLETEELFEQTGDPTEDYFTYREIYLSLMQALDMSSWAFEHLCSWYQERTIESTDPQSDIAVVEAEASEAHEVMQNVSDEESNKISHETVQLVLARLGRHFGFKVWIASNDKSREADGERLGDYSIDELPHFNGVGPKSRRMIELIDVLWFKGTSKIVAAFEIESTTSIYSGLLRMSDLTLALDNFIFPIYIAIPESRSQNVKDQLSRLTFQRMELHKVCRFFTFEKLLESVDAMMQFASNEKAIDAISQRVRDIDEEGYY